MRTRIAVLTGATALLVTGLSVTASFAITARTWTITPGGAATAKSGMLRLKTP